MQQHDYAGQLALRHLSEHAMRPPFVDALLVLYGFANTVQVNVTTVCQHTRGVRNERHNEVDVSQSCPATVDAVAQAVQSSGPEFAHEPYSLTPQLSPRTCGGNGHTSRPIACHPALLPIVTTATGNRLLHALQRSKNRSVWHHQYRPLDSVPTTRKGSSHDAVLPSVAPLGVRCYLCNY